MNETILATTAVPTVHDGSPIAFPIALDLDGNGVTTASLAKSKAHYDFDGDGIADRTSWIGATEGFLFLDRDSNGTVTNAAEFSFIGDLAGAKTDLEGLRFFDSNQDGALSALDARFSDFRVWQDKDGDGVAETGEILTLSAAGVRSINLAGTAVTSTVKPDDVTIFNTGSYIRTNGATMVFADVGLAHTSVVRDGLPQLSFMPQAYDLKSRKYRVTTKDGGIFVTLKNGVATIDSRAGGLGGSFDLTFSNFHVGMLATIVLDLDGNGVSLTYRTKSGVRFDMNGDGGYDMTGWISRRDAFLVIDRNSDGMISDGSELSFLAEDPTARSSLDALGSLDSNNDKAIDENDARFSELRVWIDANGNGITDAGELKTLADVGVASIGLNAHAVTSSTKPGYNMVLSTTTFTRTNGLIGTVGNIAMAFEPAKKPMVAASGSQNPDAITVAAAQLLSELNWSDAARAAEATHGVTPGIATAANQLAVAMSTFSAPSGLGDLIVGGQTDDLRPMAFGAEIRHL